MINGTKYEIFRFATGFDDLIDLDPLNNTIVKRYGKYWSLGCRVDVSERIVPKLPSPEGRIEIEENFSETAVSFEINLYNQSDYSGVSTNVLLYKLIYT